MFVSYGFIAFVAVLIVLYYLIPKRFQWILLLTANFGFYFSAGIFYPVFILITSVSIWSAGILMNRCENELEQFDKKIASGEIAKPSKEERKIYKKKINNKKKRCMLLFLFLNLGILSVVKYTNFVIDNANNFLDIFGKFHLYHLDLIVPLGISFYTFQAVSYLLDVYWNRCTVQKSLPKFVLYVSFFPQLIQGPISRYGDLSTTLYQEHSFDWKQVKFGVERILWGYFKKLVIADRISPAVGIIMGDPDYYTGGFVFLGMLFYAVQLYADFTGGIDITLGIAQCFGIHIKENFIRPFFSKNIAEYWRRWHITMGTWFRDYVFYPCSISKPMKKITGWMKRHFGMAASKRAAVYITTLLVWLATGIWHGAAWHFVVWGLTNGVIILISEELTPVYEKFHKRFPQLMHLWGYKVFQIVRTFLLMCCIRLFDTYTDVTLACRQFVRMFMDFKFSGQVTMQELAGLGLTKADYLVVFIGVFVMFGVSMMGRNGSVREKVSQRPNIVRYGICMALFFAIMLFGSYGVGFDAQQFIYNQF